MPSLKANALNMNFTKEGKKKKIVATHNKSSNGTGALSLTVRAAIIGAQRLT